MTAFSDMGALMLPLQRCPRSTYTGERFGATLERILIAIGKRYGAPCQSAATNANHCRVFASDTAPWPQVALQQPTSPFLAGSRQASGTGRSTHQRRAKTETSSDERALS